MSHVRLHSHFTCMMRRKMSQHAKNKKYKNVHGYLSTNAWKFNLHHNVRHASIMFPSSVGVIWPGSECRLFPIIGKSQMLVGFVISGKAAIGCRLMTFSTLPPTIQKWSPNLLKTNTAILRQSHDLQLRLILKWRLKCKMATSVSGIFQLPLSSTGGSSDTLYIFIYRLWVRHVHVIRDEGLQEKP